MAVYPAAAVPTASAAVSSAALTNWGSQDPQLAGATSAWQQQHEPQPAGLAGEGAGAGYGDGFAAGMAAALQGLQQQPGAAGVAAGAEAQPAADLSAHEAGEDAAHGWAGGLPPPQERPPASDAEVDYLLSFMM